MNTPLTPELDPALEENDAANAWLAREVAIGFAQLEAGETVRVNSEEEFLNLARQPA